MTTELDQIVSHPKLSPEIIDQIASHAGTLDQNERSARDNLALLAQSGLLGLGAPVNHDAALPDMVAVIAELAGQCLSTAFSVWAHRMTIEYLSAAGTPWSLDAVTRLTGTGVLGVTGMASAFKDAAGCGSIELTAASAPGGYRVSGALRWASNLYPDSIMVTAAQTESGDKLVVALPLASEGVTIGDHFELLALGSTASSSVRLENVHVGDDQVLSRDIDAFLGSVRPTFLVLQSAMCAGLARRCLDEAGSGLHGVNAIFTAEFESLTAQLADIDSQIATFSAAVGGSATPTKHDLLTLRLAAADVVSAAAALEIRTAGGKGYARRTDASRRFREAAFIPVQSPSEAQVRWELRTGR